MASHATLILKKDPQTGKFILEVGYESDSSALPMEHEEEHRKLAVGLVGKEGLEGHSRVSRQRGGGGGDGDGSLGQKIKQEG
jgi:hypothetical protein